MTTGIARLIAAFLALAFTPCVWGQASGSKSTAKRKPAAAKAKKASVKDERNWVLMFNSGTKLFNQGKFAPAREMLGKALEIAERFGETDARLADTLTAAAEADRLMGKFVVAEPMYKRAIEIREAPANADSAPKELARSLMGLAMTYTSRARFPEAEALFQRALAVEEKAFGVDHPETATALVGLAEVYRLQFKNDDAEPLFRRVVAIREKDKGPESFELAEPLSGLAATLSAKAEYDQAESMFERAIKLYERRGRDFPQIAVALYGLGEAKRMSGRPRESIAPYQKGVDLAEKHLGASHLYVGYCLGGLACAEADLGESEKAEKDFARAREILEKTLGPKHPDVRRLSTNQAFLLRRIGKVEEAGRLDADAASEESTETGDPGKPKR